MTYCVHGEIILSPTISNKKPCAPRSPKPEPEYTIAGWHNGYEFRQFLGNCYAFLGDFSKLDGMQQLSHQYYLQNGDLSARETAKRILHFLGLTSESKDRDGILK